MRYLTPINVISVTIILGIAYYLSVTHAAAMAASARRSRPVVDTYLDLEQVPEGTAPASLGNRIPYHAIDAIPSKMDSQLSTVTAASCRAVDISTSLEKVGNFRQVTNNFKRGIPIDMHSNGGCNLENTKYLIGESPDSCSAPNQELVLSFYDTKSVKIFGN